MIFKQEDPETTECYDCGLSLQDGDSYTAINDFIAAGNTAFFHTKCWYEKELS